MIITSSIKGEKGECFLPVIIYILVKKREYYNTNEFSLLLLRETIVPSHSLPAFLLDGSERHEDRD